MEKDRAAIALRTAQSLKTAWSDFSGLPGGMLHYLLEVESLAPIHVQELSVEVGVTQQATGKMLKEMYVLELVDIRSDKKDRRSKLITITDEGRRVLNQLRKV